MNLIRHSLTLLLLLTGIYILGCSDKKQPTPEADTISTPVAEIKRDTVDTLIQESIKVELTLSLDTAPITLEVGSETTLVASILPDSEPQIVIWDIADTTLLALDDSLKLTALNPGTTYVTATIAQNLEIYSQIPITIQPKPKPKPKVKKKKKTKLKPKIKKKIIRKRKKPPEPVVEEPVLKETTLRILSAPPFASIQVNGEPWGNTPMKIARKVEPGSFNIKVRHRIFPNRDTTIDIKVGEETIIKFKLKEKE